jgi:hypothetical protein
MTQQLSQLAPDHLEFPAGASRERGAASFPEGRGGWGESLQDSSSNSSGAAQSDVQRAFQQNHPGNSPKAAYARVSSTEPAL